MTIPQQRGAVHHVAQHAVPVAEVRATPWLDWLWIVPLIIVVAAVVLTLGCWIVDLLSAVDFGTANTLATFTAGTATCITTWRWFL